MTVTIVTSGHRAKLLLTTLTKAGADGIPTDDLARRIYGTPDRTRDVLALIGKLKHRHAAPIENLIAWPPGRGNHGRYRLTDDVTVRRPRRVKPSAPGKAPCRCDAMREGKRCPACSMREVYRSGRHVRSRPSLRPDVWTPLEDAFLSTLVGRSESEMAAAFLARFRIARTGGAIRARMCILGLATRQDGLTCQALSRLFGVTPDRVLYAWIRHGLLVATKGEPARQAKRDGTRQGWWRVDPAEVERFIRHFPWEYDYRVMDPADPLTTLAQQVAHRQSYLTIKEAARALGASSSLVARLVREGKLAARKVTPAFARDESAAGRDVRIAAADVAVAAQLRRAGDAGAQPPSPRAVQRSPAPRFTLTVIDRALAERRVVAV